MEKLEVHVEQLDARGKARSQFQTSFEGQESMTVQSDAQEADIVHILRKYAQVGLVDNLNMAEAMFKDISEFTDFADAMRHASEAESEFLRLPSKVREIFDHDVANWLDAAHDDDKRDLLREAGIIMDGKGSEEPPEKVDEFTKPAAPAGEGARVAGGPEATEPDPEGSGEGEKVT